MPDLYIITGSNGSGKSTLGFSYLPKIIQNNYNIFDGDKLTMQKWRELYRSVTPSSKEATRLANEWVFNEFERLVKRALSTRDDFAYEGHFAGDESWKTITRFRKAGYRVHLIFFGLRDTNLSELRVMDRATQGGHNVPVFEIHRNYYGNLYQLNKKYKRIDELKIVDTSASNSHKVLAIFKNGNVEQALHHGQIPEWFEKFLPALFNKIIRRDNDDFFGRFEE